MKRDWLTTIVDVLIFLTIGCSILIFACVLFDRFAF
jgi:hypothetical protein